MITFQTNFTSITSFEMSFDDSVIKDFHLFILTPFLLILPIV